MGGMKKKIKKQKVRSQAQSEQFEKDQAQVPRSMIFRRGNVGDAVKDLVQNMRLVMSPHSALKLRERKNNQLKDFINAANVLHVTHFMMFSQTALSVTLRICRVPRGPTLSFRLLSYTTMRAVALTQKKPHSQGVEYQYAPLVVLNGFSGPENHKKIMTATFQNMFPGLDIARMKLDHCRRIVLFNYNAEDDTIDVRHYYIAAVPVGLTKGIRKVIKGVIPEMHAREDVADYVDNPATMSDSEAELPEDTRVELGQALHGRGNAKSGTSAIKLKELGPRMRLQLVKVEEGVGSGAVLYHAHLSKTEEEALALEKRKAEGATLKAERRAAQEANVLRKQQERAELQRAKEAQRAARTEARRQQLLARAAAGEAAGSEDDGEADEKDEKEEEEEEEEESGDGEDGEGGDFDGDLQFDEDEEEEEEGRSNDESEEESGDERKVPPAARGKGQPQGLAGAKRKAAAPASEDDVDDDVDEEEEEEEEEEEAPKRPAFRNGFAQKNQHQQRQQGKGQLQGRPAFKGGFKGKRPS